MKTIFSILFSLVLGHFHSQTIESPGQTYAVVIGISDYQHEDITDLQYAHRDAEAFAAFLRSPAGGSLTADQVQLLINEEATLGKITQVLDWLPEVCIKDDKAIIYFSGHGDVETITDYEPGYLLAYDTPPFSYSSNAYSVDYLDTIISKLSEKNQTEVILISDACHAGKLAGNSFGGRESVAMHLRKQKFRNETRILSCQPEELSLEGEQWGEGRGVFSFHLVAGLFGLADDNDDQIVDLFELGEYLEDRVPEETDPQSQIPEILGKKRKNMAYVDYDLLAKIRGSKDHLSAFKPIETKGLEILTLENADSNIQQMYTQFTKAMESGHLLNLEEEERTQKGHSAYDLYEILIHEPSLEPLHNLMKYNLAATLQDEAQQVLLDLIETDFSAIHRIRTLDSIRQFPAYLDKAVELLGEKHYLYPGLMCKKHYFQARVQILEGLEAKAFEGIGGGGSGVFAETKDQDKARQELETALHFDDQASFVYEALGNISEYDAPEFALEMYKKALEISPGWYYLYLNLSNANKWLKNVEEAKYYLAKYAEHAEGFNFYFELGRIYFVAKEFSKVLEIHEELIEKDSTKASYHFGLVRAYVGLKDYENMEKNLLKGFELLYKGKPWTRWAKADLGSINLWFNKWSRAEFFFQSLLEEDSTQIQGLLGLGMIYYKLGQPEEAVQYLKKAINSPRSNSMRFAPQRWLAYIYNFTNRFREAQGYYEEVAKLDPRSTRGAFPFQIPFLHSGSNDLGIFYLRTGKFVEGMEALKKAASFTPRGHEDNFEPHYNLARAYYHLGQYAYMKESLLRAIDIDSTYATTYTWLGLAEQGLGNYEATEKAFYKDMTLNFDHSYMDTTNRSFPYYHLAVLRAKQGRNDEALELLEEALKRGGYPHEFLVMDVEKDANQYGEEFRRRKTREFILGDERWGELKGDRSW